MFYDEKRAPIGLRVPDARRLPLQKDAAGGTAFLNVLICCLSIRGLVRFAREHETTCKDIRHESGRKMYRIWSP